MHRYLQVTTDAKPKMLSSAGNIVWGDADTARNALWALGQPVDMG